ncbi:MAG: GNAT family N-acetyltransferase, partial [Planctomycetes bacterium]|nr:GNAT family N-acetyltransferase [Planctomycetota bacterium]
MTISPQVRDVPKPRPVRSDFQLQLGQLLFKIAETEEEFRQVHRLNYDTFVREIRQHADPGTGYLVDKFHDKNVYFIAVREGRVVGMLSAHDRPPFSIAERLSDPSVLDRLDGRPLEVRLLAIEPAERHKLVFAGLIWTLYQYARHQGYSHFLISGLTERMRLYERFGFRALGPPKRSGQAEYVPMVLDLRELPADVWRDIASWQQRLRRARLGKRAEPVL